MGHLERVAGKPHWLKATKSFLSWHESSQVPIWHDVCRILPAQGHLPNICGTWTLGGNVPPGENLTELELEGTHKVI